MVNNSKILEKSKTSISSDMLQLNYEPNWPINRILEMDEATFQKELVKYKVIRGPDYCKAHIKNKVVTKPSSAAPLALTSQSKEKAPVINPNESNFWELFSAANSSILTTAESMKFIKSLKSVCFSLSTFL
jgi:hypothetical protein